jgi:glyoxylate reductase
MSRKAAAFGMKIQYFSRTRLSADEEKAAGDAVYVPFGTLLSTSDVLSSSLPLTKDTRHIISYPEFQKMKDGVVIVNTARGSVMNEIALVQALRSGKVRSAGLDVYEDEPRPHAGLLENENVLLLPHMGTHTRQTHKTMEIMVINNIRSAITEDRLINPVN